jgi:dynein heavy chain
LYTCAYTFLACVYLHAYKHTYKHVPALQILAASKDGAYVHGLIMEGARWDDKVGALEESRHKELFAKMPVVLIKAVTADKTDQKDVYLCPVYRTQDRGPTFVFLAGLRTKAPAAKWTMAGVAIIMDVV